MNKLCVITWVLSDWQLNTYAIHKKDSKECFIIDAGPHPKKVISDLKIKNIVPKLLIYTHSHLDHIAGANEIVNAFPNIKTAVSKVEADYLGDTIKNMSAGFGNKITAPPADIHLQDGYTLTLEDMDFKVITTPGHSPGGICLYQEDESILFAGDTLFKGSVGRYDFPDSDGALLFKSIREKLFILPDDTMVFPGHGGNTTIGNEKKYNPFL